MRPGYIYLIVKSELPNRNTYHYFKMFDVVICEKEGIDSHYGKCWYCEDRKGLWQWVLPVHVFEIGKL